MMFERHEVFFKAVFVEFKQQNEDHADVFISFQF
jgi:hypothetical protein